MARRVTFPSADDLFRPTTPQAQEEQAGSGEHDDAGDRGRPVGAVGSVPTSLSRRRTAREGRRPATAATAESPEGQSSGRVRHDEKMTVYVTSAELLAIEQARLSLRATQGVAVDRGRLVREAVAIALADLEANGAESRLVRRLLEE